MQKFMMLLVAGVFFATGPVHAAGSSDPPAPADLAEMISAREHVKAERYKEAIPQLEKVVAAQPQNADALNLLAFSQRKLNDLAASLENYKKALKIDPAHKDAHEYVGELYLRMDDLANAEKHLKRLDDICIFSCEQFNELKAAIEAYKKKKGLS